MFGSAAQNIIALSDSVFLYHLSEIDFAAIGFISVFYLIIAAVGFGFSKGGQILIARQYGARNYKEIGRSFYTLMWFEMGIATLMFLLMQYVVPHVFEWFVESKAIYQKSMEYLHPRSIGVFFSYAGLVFFALYMGMARTRIIMWSTIILATINIILNYGLIFGKWGLPFMGIAGAGWASTIAEAITLCFFIGYVVADRKVRIVQLYPFEPLKWWRLEKIWRMSSPLVGQALLGMGSWFLFFTFVEKLGERALAISNLIRIVYLILSIPAWGYSATINTLVSNFIGAQKRLAVWPIIKKTAQLSVFNTTVLALPVCLLPEYLLYPFFGSEQVTLLQEAKPLFYLLLPILGTFSYGLIVFNGLLGTGKTFHALRLQTYTVVIYVLYLWAVVAYAHSGLIWAWCSEIVYWLLIILLSRHYLIRNKWR